ncbi:MAG: hypothetical protein E7277_07295, partial [Lachnospiraceae bacterium]|nr:hypothetical protein [Lachnospiraceae bacterium]
MGRQTWKKRLVKIEALGLLLVSLCGLLLFGADRWAAMAVLKLQAPLITYETEGEPLSMVNLLGETFLKQLPLYEYLTEKSYEQTSVESGLPYGLVMRMEEKKPHKKEKIGPVMTPQVPEKDFRKAVLHKYGRKKLASYAFLVSHFYHVDATTRLSPRLLKFQPLFYRNLTLTPSKTEPRILIYHTHAHEEYKNTKGYRNKTVVNLGDELTHILRKKYNITVLHHKGVYDDNRNVAYSKALPHIEKLLKK